MQIPCLSGPQELDRFEIREYFSSVDQGWVTRTNKRVGKGPISPENSLRAKAYFPHVIICGGHGITEPNQCKPSRRLKYCEGDGDMHPPVPNVVLRQLTELCTR